ncbi:MAG: MFS transporter [Lentisphaeria bacterium]|nr:MFS transporter [Lentisphaeria bacterium]
MDPDRHAGGAEPAPGREGHAGVGAKGWIVYPAALTTAAGIGTLTLGMIFFARETHGATPTAIGFLASTWSLGYILGCQVLRPVAEGLLPRYSILAASLSMSLAAGLMLRAASLPLVFVCYGFYGTAASFFWPPLMGWLSTGFEGPRLNRAMGTFNICWSAGAIAGPLIAGVLARLDPHYPVAFSAVVFAVTALYTLAAIVVLRGLDAEDGSHRAMHRAGHGQTVKDSGGTSMRFPAWVGLFAAYAVLGLVLNVFPLAAGDHLGLGKPAVGFLLLVRALATTLALVVLGRTVFWHFRLSQLVIGLGIFALALVFLPHAHHPAAIAAVLAVLGALLAHSYANSLFHGVSGSRRRAYRMALHESLLSAGLVVGGACGGVLYQAMGYATVCRTAAGVLAAAAVAALVVGRFLQGPSPAAAAASGRGPGL